MLFTETNSRQQAGLTPFALIQRLKSPRHSRPFTLQPAHGEDDRYTGLLLFEIQNPNAYTRDRLQRLRETLAIFRAPCGTKRYALYRVSTPESCHARAHRTVRLKLETRLGVAICPDTGSTPDGAIALCSDETAWLNRNLPVLPLAEGDLLPEEAPIAIPPKTYTRRIYLKSRRGLKPNAVKLIRAECGAVLPSLREGRTAPRLSRVQTRGDVLANDNKHIVPTAHSPPF